MTKLNPHFRWFLILFAVCALLSACQRAEEDKPKQQAAAVAEKDKTGPEEAPEIASGADTRGASDLIEMVKRGEIASVRSAVDAEKSLANLKREDGVPLIYFAAANGHRDIVEYLLDMGAAIDASTDSGSALHVAADNEHFGIIEELVTRGADVNLRNDWDQTPLHNTTQNAKAEITKLLISKGADVSAIDYRGRTPLHRCKSKLVAEALIANGADVNATDSKGYTPLHWAGTPREIVDEPTIKLFLASGADVAAKDKLGLTPRQLAKKNEQDKLIVILDSHTP